MTFKMKQLPPIRVGPHDIGFAWLKGKEAQNNLGAFTHDDQLIKLRREYTSGTMAADTVLHEVIHAAFAIGSIETNLGEEHIVSALSTTLIQIIRDNPELMAWIQETVKK